MGEVGDLHVCSKIGNVIRILPLLVCAQEERGERKGERRGGRREVSEGEGGGLT